MASNRITFNEFLKKPEPYYVIDIKYDYWNPDIEANVVEVLKEQSTGWYYSASSFHPFENPEDRDLVKRVIGWKELEKTI